MPLQFPRQHGSKRARDAPYKRESLDYPWTELPLLLHSVMNEQRDWFAVLVFAFTYLLIAFPQLKLLPIGRPAA